MSYNTLDDKFIELPSSALIVSLIIHGSLLFCIVSVKVLDKLGIDLFTKKNDVTKQMYQSFIQVDVVGLPQNLINEQTALDTTLPITEKPKVTKEEVSKDKFIEEEMKLAKEAAEAKAKEEEFSQKEKKKKELADKKAKEAEEAATAKKQKFEKEKALKQLEMDAKREQALKGLQSKAGKAGRGKVVGNILSQGTSSSGAIGTAKDRYRGLVGEEIKQHFNIYLWQKKKQLAAEVHLELLPNGKVKSRKITKPSSDPLYDSAVLLAIDQSTFPAPDEDSILTDGIDIYFTP